MTRQNQHWLTSREIVERIVIEGNLVLQTPAHFGSGNTEGVAELSLLRDPYDGAALLPGASIAGALRNYWRERKRGYGAKAQLQNALLMFPGISPSPAVGGGCVCFSPRFDVDGFGRVFMPDVATFSVRVVDANANPIVRFGGYGNMDSRGPGSAIPTPAIALAWPQYVAVSNEAAYVSDVINRRIVRVKLSYAVEAQSPITDP